MKTYLIISAVLAITALANAAPTPEIVAKVKEIKTLVRTTLDDIEAAAIADDAVLGQKIKDKLEEGIKKAAVLFQEARELDANPTKADAEEKLSKLLAILGESKEAVKDDLKLLKPETQELIKEKFHSGVTKAKALIAEIKASPDLS